MARPKAPNKVRNLVVVLGDQLSLELSSLTACDKALDLVLMCEVVEEATYVRHHKKKIILLFSAMRHFADELRAQGWRVAYTRLDDDDNSGSLAGEVARAVATHRPERILITEPGEWRVLEIIRSWSSLFNLPVDVSADTRFVCSTEDFAAWTKGRKQLRMEYFYRDMRRKTGLFMDDLTPVGGQWNFDHDNRKTAKADLFIPEPAHFQQDATTLEVVALVKNRFSDHFGDADPFWFAVTRADAEAAFDHFIDVGLAQFGDYQDAMLTGQRFLYHSIVSMYLNCGLLNPLSMCRKVEAAYRAGRVPLNAAEGYIRQVIGWREYVRGIYWLKMPEYAASNGLTHVRQLPDFYWTGETDMRCMREAITQTKEEAYAHHIQRLMVTGNFALLAGISPQALHEWYLAVYADAYEWVELPNTIGMSQFADGGLLASKPYAASGAYINRMSDYCGSCAYDVKHRTGARACPFNALYWDFIRRHAATIKTNPRMAQMVRTYEKFADDEKERIVTSATNFLADLKPSMP
ncbi:MAG: cryptochrome/photolyase family protein [Hyphomicrobiaceae bacterium]